jgi:hypothetical protein
MLRLSPVTLAASYHLSLWIFVILVQDILLTGSLRWAYHLLR